MATQSTSIPASPQGWFQAFRRQGLHFRQAASATLVIGLYLHITNLFIGRDLLQQHILTPAFDMVLAVPMTYAGITGWILWRRVIHPALWHRIVYGFLVLYFTISIPVHVRTFITGRTDYIHAFPEQYSLLLVPVLVALLVFVQRLRFKDDGTHPIGQSLPVETEFVGRRSSEVGRDRTHRARQLLLFSHGLFLLAAGGVQLVLEILGHFVQAGPYAMVFGNSPYTIGFVEAHGLAVLIGILLVRAASTGSERHWHLFAAGVALLLGGANLLFWESFVVFGMVVPGIVATTLHGIFLASQLACFVQPTPRV